MSITASMGTYPGAREEKVLWPEDRPDEIPTRSVEPEDIFIPRIPVIVFSLWCALRPPWALWCGFVSAVYYPAAFRI